MLEAPARAGLGTFLPLTQDLRHVCNSITLPGWARGRRVSGLADTGDKIGGSMWFPHYQPEHRVFLPLKEKLYQNSNEMNSFFVGPLIFLLLKNLHFFSLSLLTLCLCLQHLPNDLCSSIRKAHLSLSQTQHTRNHHRSRSGDFWF